MRKSLLFSLSIVVSMTICSLKLAAQKSVDKTIYYYYTQCPLKPLATKNYDYVIYQNDEQEKKEEAAKSDEESEALKLAFETDIKLHYDRLFELDQRMYKVGEDESLSLVKKQVEMGTINNQTPKKPARPDIDYKRSMDLYSIELNLYNARLDSLNNTNLKLFFKEQVRAIIKESEPSKPFVKKSGPAEYKIPEAIISERMKINGLQRVNTDVEKTRFEISIASFESKEERKKEKEKEFEVNVLSYRRITGYKIYDSSNNIIAEGMVPESDKWSTETLALSVLPKEKKIIVDNLIQKSAENNLVNAKNFIEEKYGYPVKRRGVYFYYAKGKEFDYSDIEKSYEKMKSIFEDRDVSIASNINELKDLISIWEKEIQTADYTNKKARINQEIAVGLYFNIIECSIWLKDFNKFSSTIDELNKLELKSKDKRYIEIYKEFSAELQSRLQANNLLASAN